MLTALFTIYIVICLLYLIWVPRKEMAMLVILHAFVQYAMTLTLWFFQINSQLTALLLGFMFATSILLLWARNINYSQEWLAVRIFFSLVQWSMIVFIISYLIFQPAYNQFVPSIAWQGKIAAQHLAINPVIKVCGNLILFTSFFQIMLHWGQKWTIKKSLFNLGPMIIYFIIMSLLKIFQSYTENSPYI